MKKLLLLTGFALSFVGTNAQTLVHYWNFNQPTVTAAKTPTSSLTTPVASMVSDTSKTGNQNPAELLGSGTIGNLNARNGDVAGNHYRFNEPIEGKITFSLPTNGFKEPILKYEAYRSGSGAGKQIISYTVNGNDFIVFDSVTVLTTASMFTIDFKSINAVNNNPDFKVQITFKQGDGGIVGNNRFDNVTLEATSLVSGDITPPFALITPSNNSLNVAVTDSVFFVFNERVKLTNGISFTNSIVLKENDKDGNDVAFNALFLSDSILAIIPSQNLQNGKQYFVSLIPNTIEDLAGNKLILNTASSFRTISTTSNLKAGSIVPVAIQTSSTSTGNLAYDRVAVLFLENVAEGTAISITDAKYTSNNGQCAGGFVWFAPKNGVKAGEVVSFITENASLSTSSGTVTGSGYGLSSGGEQIFFYTGNNSNPTYLTAISTNAWLADGTTHTTCGGSISLRPATLNDTSSISLSTATGNNNGVVVNAFYNGIFDLNAKSSQEIRAAVLNPANWVTAPAGPAQNWINWNMAGPVRVLSSEIISSNQIRIVFNKDLDANTATNTANYGIQNNPNVIANVSNNGVLADTVILTYPSNFVDGAQFSLNVNGILAKNGLAMELASILNFTFIAKAKVSFAQNFRVLTEGGNTTITLNTDKVVNGKAKLVLKGVPFSTAISTDHDFLTQEIIFNNENSKSITINAIDDNLIENDEYFVIELEVIENLEIQGFQYATIHVKDNDKKAPVATKEIELKLVTSFDPSPNGSTTEAIAYDASTYKLYASSAVQNRFDIIDFSTPAFPTTIKSVDMSPYGGGITGVTVYNGLVAVGAPASDQTQQGKVVFFNSNGDYITDVTVGALPDMVKFTPDGKKVLTADEGQPNSDYTFDPEGTVSVIDVSGGAQSINQSKVKVISLQGLNANEAQYIAAGVRKTFKNSTLSKDLEPEYITFSDDSKKAWVICQENNAMLELDLENDTLVDIWALGTKDYSKPGNGADMAAASPTQNNVLIANWPVKGYYQPDALATYTIGNKHYIVTANEGDEKEYGGLNERTTVGNNSVVLDPVKFPHAAVLKQNYNIGGFRISNIKEYADPDNDGDYDELFAVGARSFSIFDADDKVLVYDSGDDFDYITSQHSVFSPLYNASHDNTTFKGRSITKGAEPEALDIATIDGQVYAFVGLERIGGVMVYNITNPQSPYYVDYANNRSLTGLTGDLGPEYVVYINEDKSPNGNRYILVSNEISGTITVFEVVKDGNVFVDNLNATQGLTIYPNPAKNVVNLSEERFVELYSLSGQILFSGKTKQISLNGFTKGMYILKTNQGEVRKLIVE